MLPTLYQNSTSGKVKEWSVTTDGDMVIMSYGLVGGKIKSSVVRAESKNVGKSNETTPEEQAKLEAISRFNAQKLKGYTEVLGVTENEHPERPMLAIDYSKRQSSVIYPAYAQPKLDGVRCLMKKTSDTFVNISRGGTSYKLNKELEDQIQLLIQETGFDYLDGELYIHLVSLQKIKSAVSKPNELSDSVMFYIFDIPLDIPFSQRYLLLNRLSETVKRLGLNKIRIVPTHAIFNDKGMSEYLSTYESMGYEGLIVRNEKGIYSFGQRSPDLIKRKNMITDEALVIGCSEDRSGQGVLICESKTGKKFECKMLGSADYRAYDVQVSLIGKNITYKYQQLTDDGIPQFAVGICERSLNEKGDPME